MRNVVIRCAPLHLSVLLQVSLSLQVSVFLELSVFLSLYLLIEVAVLIQLYVPLQPDLQGLFQVATMYAYLTMRHTSSN